MTTLNSINFESQWLGLVDYEKSLRVQEETWQKSFSQEKNFILGLEHPSVITLGKRGNSAEDLKEAKLPVVSVDRGGQATIHSPGQLVIYPIINLKKKQMGVREFIEGLNQTTIQLLQSYNMKAWWNEKSPGVYTHKGKVAFTGIRIDRGVSRHGISINIKNDLNLFQQIVSCGVAEAHLDHIKTQDSIEKVFQKWCELYET